MFPNYMFPYDRYVAYLKRKIQYLTHVSAERYVVYLHEKLRLHFLIMCCLAGYLNCDCGPDKPFHIHVSEWQDSKLPECNDSVFAYIVPDERYVAYLQGKIQYLYPCFRRKIRCLPESKIQAVFANMFGWDDSFWVLLCFVYAWG